MHPIPFRAPLLALAALLPLASCAVATLRGGSRPPHLCLDDEGLINGHLAFGIRDEDRLFDANVLEDSLVDLTLWRLARIEVGLFRVAVGIGPVDIGLGVLASDPELPAFLGDDEDLEVSPEPHVPLAPVFPPRIVAEDHEVGMRSVRDLYLE